MSGLLSLNQSWGQKKFLKMVTTTKLNKNTIVFIPICMHST